MTAVNWILAMMAAAAVIGGICSGRAQEVGQAALSRCGGAVTLVLSLTGALCLWSGLMEVAKQAGLTKKAAALFRPLTARLFPALREDREAMALIAMNLSANLLGLGNAATPLGLAAMGEMAQKNPSRDTPTQGMILFVVINTASLQLLPVNMAAMRQSCGSAAPFSILPQVWITSAASLAVCVLCCKLLERRPPWPR